MFQDIPVKKLIPSKSNYRRSFDEAAMTELTASIKSKGVLQPILVRPLNGKQKGSFEIVAGHRRFTAAKDAGLKDIPALVKELSDEDALECQVIENHQREDVNLMDEAEGFKRLLDMGKHTPETLAAKIDCSISYVLGRVKLMELDKKVQDAIASGELGPGHAVLFTRLKNSGDQKELLKEILDDEMSVRSAKDYIRRNYSLTLKDAPFDTADCSTCPSRSRNQTVLFDDLKKTDECTDKACYASKTRMHYKGMLDEKKAEGFKVYTDAKKVEKLLNDCKDAVRIAASKREERYDLPYPTEYKKQCMECKENHAFFVREDRSYDGRIEISFGELCLNKPCLKAMQNAEKKAARQAASSTSSPSGPNHSKIKEAARECRDRFLLATLPARVEADDYLVDKLIILQLYRSQSFLRQSDFLKQVIGEAVPMYEGDPGVYRKLTEKFPGYGGKFHQVLSKALLFTINETLCDTLLTLAPEAGVVMTRDFAVDEPWLKGKTKDELSALVSELALDIEVKASAKKGDLISAILEQDLKGRVPKEFEEVLKVKEAEEKGEEYYCINCGDTAPDSWLAVRPSTGEAICNACPDELEGIKDADSWKVLGSDSPNGGDGEDEYPETGTETEPEASLSPSPSMGEGRGEGEENPSSLSTDAQDADGAPDPTMPQPTDTKRKRKPRARA